MGTESQLIPGVYPEIVKVLPKIGGNNNLGVGVDLSGNQYVLKDHPGVCVAEFVGAAVCRELGLKHPLPNIVKRTSMFGQSQHLFGSSMVTGLLPMDFRSVADWKSLVPQLESVAIFSVVLAVDLALGNDDRHQDNWLVKAAQPEEGRHHHEMITMDFSNAWPCANPPHHPLRHPSPNTWNLAGRHWPALGIDFDRATYRATCSKIANLSTEWLAKVLQPMLGIWFDQAQFSAMQQWWANHWKDHMLNVVACLECDGDWQ